MILQSAFAVIGVDLRAESFVLHHDVEDVTQHFISNDIGFRPHGSRARVKIQTSHFAKQVAGTE
jgi:hypothetical protein